MGRDYFSTCIKEVFICFVVGFPVDPVLHGMSVGGAQRHIEHFVCPDVGVVDLLPLLLLSRDGRADDAGESIDRLLATCIRITQPRASLKKGNSFV